MKYQLVYIKNKSEKTRDYDTIWQALKAAITILEETELQVEGIKSGDDLLGKPEYILRSAAINSIWLTLSNCPNGYWRE